MAFIKELKQPRFIFCKPFNTALRIPCYTFYKYRIYKLEILARWTDPELIEQVYIATNHDGSENCIIYLTFNSPEEVQILRYFRDDCMDSEICGFMVMGFLKKGIRT